MDTPLLDQIRYLEICLAACQARPALHEHQIAAYSHQLELARTMATALDYLRAMERSGTTMEIARAEWLDRYANWSRVYRALGDEDKLQAAQRNFEAARDAAPDGFLAAVIAAKRVSGPMHQAAETCQNIVPNLVFALLDWACEGSERVRSDHELTVQAFWNQLREHDPRCTWQRIASYPPYRQRIPFDDARVAIMGEWLRQVVGTALCDTPAGAPAGGDPDDARGTVEASGYAAQPDRDKSGGASQVSEVPSAAQAALPYHMASDALVPGAVDSAVMGELYQRIFAMEAESDSGPALLRKMAEESMYCRLARDPQIAVARRALDHCRGQSQPHLEFHYQQVLARLDRCRTATEVEYEIEALGQFAAVEAAWNDIALRYAIKPVVATCAYQSDPGAGQRATIEHSSRIAADFFGHEWNRLLRSPRMWDFFSTVLYPGSQTLNPPEHSPGLYWGEIGFASVDSARQAVVWRVMEQIRTSFQDTAPTPEAVQESIDRAAQTRLFDSPEAFAACIEELFVQAMGDEPWLSAPDQASRRELLMWGHPVQIDDLLAAAAAPPRPDVADDD